MTEKSTELFELLYNKSFIYREDPPFTLASGKESFYYFDCKATTLNPKGVALVGEVMFDKIEGLVKDKNITAIGGLTLGADPISISIAICAQKRGYDLSPLIVRKEAKKHGTGKGIEGSLKDVKDVIVIDDVITTGGSTIIAIERMREAGLNIANALVLIDREEGGRENIEDTGIPVISLYTRSDFDEKRLGGAAG
ncbi:orotate phosphoribosyltransferase [Spirochaetota bacterium]